MTACVLILTCLAVFFVHLLLRAVRALEDLASAIRTLPAPECSLSAPGDSVGASPLHAPLLPDEEPGLYRAGRQDIAEAIDSHRLAADVLRDSGLSVPLSHLEAGAFDDD